MRQHTQSPISELERRGHTFCRYAEDSRIYVASRRAGERVKESVTVFLVKRGRLKVAPEPEARLKAKLKDMFRRGRGRSLQRVIEEMKLVLIG